MLTEVTDVGACEGVEDGRGRPRLRREVVMEGAEGEGAEGAGSYGQGTGRAGVCGGR